MEITRQTKASLIRKIKRTCGVTDIRPLFMNTVMNELGLLQINEYNVDVWGKGRTLKPSLDAFGFITTRAHNADVLKHRWENNSKDLVIYDITHDGNEARNLYEIGICLIEVLDANVLSKEEFDELYNIVIQIAKRNDDLYERLKQAMLKEITRDKNSIKAWESISLGFKDRIGLEIWQGDLKTEHLSK